MSSPSTESLSPEDHESFHQACRGKALCRADQLPGLASNNSYCLFDQGPDGYPFGLGRHLPNQKELWDILDGVAWGVLGELSPDAPGRTTGLAVRWVASLDCALQRVLGDPADFWRYHASTLFFAIDQLANKPEEELLSILSRSVGQKNWETFSRIWHEAEACPVASGHLDRLAAIALTPAHTSEGRWSLLREIVHCTLKQFGVPVPLHLPVVFFAFCIHASRRLEHRKVST